MEHKLWGALFVVSLAIASPMEAEACSCGETPPVVFTANGKVPADFGGIAVWGGYPDSDSIYEPSVTVDRWVEGAWIPEEAVVDEIENPGSNS